MNALEIVGHHSGLNTPTNVPRIGYGDSFLSKSMPERAGLSEVKCQWDEASAR